MRRLASVVLTLILLPAPARAQGAYVTFASLDPKFHGQLTATLYKPPGDGPFPAMVLLHTCSGIQGFVIDWAQWFVEQGYAGIVVDSFGPRGVASLCGVGGYPNERVRALDAYGALAYLRTRSDVDANRVGVIGWSHGGGTVLATEDSGTGFRAAVAFYPPCEFMPGRNLSAPLLALLGAKDDWTPSGPCDRSIAALAKAGQPASDYVYPDATHAFDNPSARGVTHIRSHVYTLIYNPSDADDAHARVAAFLQQTMR